MHTHTHTHNQARTHNHAWAVVCLYPDGNMKPRAHELNTAGVEQAARQCSIIAFHFHRPTFRSHVKIGAFLLTRFQVKCIKR